MPQSPLILAMRHLSSLVSSVAKKAAMKLDVNSMTQTYCYVNLEANCRLLDRKWNAKTYKALTDTRQAEQKGI